MREEKQDVKNGRELVERERNNYGLKGEKMDSDKELTNGERAYCSSMSGVCVEMRLEKK